MKTGTYHYIMTKLLLDTTAMEEDFFEGIALIGISCSLPVYRFCWLVNNKFDINFVREPSLDVVMKPGKNSEEKYFPVYQYLPPHTEEKYILYKIKDESSSLMPEVRKLDFLWMLQNMHEAKTEAAVIVKHLKKFPEVQLAQLLKPEKLKSLGHLLI